VTAKVSFNGQALRPVRDPADHVSLSSIFNCQKTDGSTVQVPKAARTPNQGPVQFSTAPSRNLRASELAARSAQRPLDERRYKPTPSDTSTGQIVKMQKTDKPLNYSHYSFEISRRRPRRRLLRPENLVQVVKFPDRTVLRVRLPPKPPGLFSPGHRRAIQRQETTPERRMPIPHNSAVICGLL